MSRKVIVFIGAIALFGLGAIVGVLVSNAIFAGDGQPSEEISAPTLDPNVTPTPSYSQLQATIEALEGELEAALAEPEPTEAPAEEEADAEEEATEEDTADTATGERLLYRIAQEQSEARFYIDEILAGEEITVVGTTNQVAGDVIVDFSNPASSQVGTIRINVRTLRTDNNFRDDAIRGRVLQSSRDEFEFAEFVPAEIIGLPESVAVGETIEFEIIGDLTLRDVTRTLTFNATVTVTDEQSLAGVASTTFPYRDFNLTVPQPPSVSFIADDVTIEIDFVALRVES
ncbi:MAG: YceI family protein [Anaerolineaceae bacterium]|nr:MAG: YceI family protein [Anaerolineaceae bacterium]